MLPRSCRGRKSAYYELLFLMHLDLEPFAGTPPLVRSIAILGNQPFEAFAFGDAISSNAISRQTTRKQELFRCLAKGGFQFMPTARKWFRSKIPAIAIKAIENCEAPRKVSTLEELEARNSFRIERYNLTVENHRLIS